MDFKKLSDNLGLEENEFVELVEVLVATAAVDIEKLKSAYDSGDIKQVAEVAHSLKGAAGNLGFVELSEIAKTVEYNARENDTGDPDYVVSTLKEKLEAINNHLKNF